MIEIPFFTASASLGRRFGMRNLFLAGVAVSIVTLVGYALARSPAGVAVFRSLAGVSFGLKYGALVVLTDRLVPEHLRNTGQALMQTASWGLGPVIGPAIGGFVLRPLRSADPVRRRRGRRGRRGDPRPGGRSATWAAPDDTRRRN